VEAGKRVKSIDDDGKGGVRGKGRVKIYHERGCTEGGGGREGSQEPMG